MSGMQVYAPPEHATDSIRVYRAAAASTGAGNAAQVVFDSTSSLVTVDDFSLSSGKLAPIHSMVACVKARVSVTGGLLATSATAYLIRERGGADQVLEQARIQVGIGGTYELHLFAMPELEPTDLLRVDVASSGAALSINTGDGVTFLEARAI